jgi:YfiH family protein
LKRCSKGFERDDPVIHALTPEWPAPPGVRALSTLRGPGGSQGPYQGLNLGAHVGDDPDQVHENRALLTRHLGLSKPPAWLDQVHGTTCVKANPDDLETADASFTDQVGIACIVMTADCLPVLFATRDGQRVAAAHAGWKGLAGGVLEATLASLGTHEVLAWLGPAIGPQAFEVGPEVRDAFLNRHPDAGQAFSNPHKDRYHADLYELARCLLTQAGVPDDAIYGGGHCTYLESDAFFSYRRDRTTGRMASLIWREQESP